MSENSEKLNEQRQKSESESKISEYLQALEELKNMGVQNGKLRLENESLKQEIVAAKSKIGLLLTRIERSGYAVIDKNWFKELKDYVG